MMSTVLATTTAIAGPVMLVCQALLCAGNLLSRNYNAGMYWAGGVLLTVGALRMGGNI